MWERLNKIIKSNGAIVLFGSQPFTSALISSNYKMFKYEWIWKKNAGSNFGTVRFQPMKEHENVLIFAKGKTIYNPQMQERSESGKARVLSGPITYFDNKREDYVYDFKKRTIKKVANELRYPSSVQLFNRQRGLHPTQKPVPLLEYLIKTYTNEGELVLDFTMGSGSTGVACMNTNRRFIGIELDEKYFEIACKRLESGWRIKNIF